MIELLNMHEWVNDWMHEWLTGWMNERMTWMTWVKWMKWKEGRNEWRNEGMNRMNEMNGMNGMKGMKGMELMEWRKEQSNVFMNEWNNGKEWTYSDIIMNWTGMNQIILNQLKRNKTNLKSNN